MLPTVETRRSKFYKVRTFIQPGIDSRKYAESNEHRKAGPHKHHADQCYDVRQSGKRPHVNSLIGSNKKWRMVLQQKVTLPYYGEVGYVWHRRL